MKTSFTTAVIAAIYLANSTEAQNFPRFLQDETCQPQDQATFKSFEGKTTQKDSYFLKGRDGKALCTDADKIEMGFDNRAFVLNEANDDSIDKAFKHKYLGGTLKFNVDVSDVGCNCAAGVFLVALDDKDCNWDGHDSSSPPQCPTIDVMVANTSGIKTQSKPCENGSCDATKFCKSDKLYGAAYGAGSGYFINTLEPYRVETQFFADSSNNLTSIQTWLSQNNAYVPLELDCDFQSLSGKLDQNMAMAISTFSLDTSANPFTDQCTEVCSSASTIISGITWSAGDAIDDDSDDDDNGDDDGDDGDDDAEPTLIWGDAAPDLLSGYCDNVACSECRESWYDDDPDDKRYRCKDDTVFAYRNKCGKKKLKKEGMDLCMTGDDQLCHWSFPIDDPKKGRSEKAACRTIPHDYIDGFEWKFSKKQHKKYTNGLCRYGCEEEEGTCHWSWPMGEKGKNNPKAMFRCKPKSEDPEPADD